MKDQKRVNQLDESKPVAVLYFYRGPERTLDDRKLLAHLEYYGWGM